MLRPQRIILHLLILCLALATRSFAADPLAAIEAMPASNPYRAALVQWASLPDEDRKAVDNWISPPDEAAPPVLTTAQKTIVRDLTSAVAATATSPATTAADWAPVPDPKDPDNPFNGSFPTVGPILTLARIAAKTAETLPNSEAIATYAAVAQLGRQQRTGSTLIQQLVGVAIESNALAGASKDLLRFSPAELKQLSAAWSGLQPSPSVETAMAGERDMFLKPFMERTILPGMRAWLAEEAANLAADNPDSPRPAGQDATGRTFTRDLRLSGLMDLGDGERRILLENTQTHLVTTLREGHASEGMTLTGIDFEKRRAYIHHEKGEAVIYLTSKQIVERSHAAAKFRTVLKSFSGSFSSEPGGSDKAIRVWLDKIRAHPDGADGYIRDLLITYQQILDQQIASAAQAKATPDDATPPPDDPYLRALVPTLGRVARTLQNVETQSVMFQAAINHRLNSLGQTGATPPPDPWSDEGASFTMEPTPDGGFLMRSRYEALPGKPLTYKFAAPDAGFVRVP